MGHGGRARDVSTVRVPGLPQVQDNGTAEPSEPILNFSTGLAVADSPANNRLDVTVTGAPPNGAAGGDLAGTYPNPTVTQARGLRETAGPTTLAMGAVADGEYLKRSGATLIGAAAAAVTASWELRSEISQADSYQVSLTRGACYLEQVKQLAINPVNNHLYEVTINGTTVGYTSDASATANEICLGLLLAIGGNATLKALVQAFYGTNDSVRIIDLDPRTATTLSVGTANLAITTPVAQTSYTEMTSGLGGTSPAAGVTFWWDVRAAMNYYANAVLGYSASLLPVGRYQFVGVAGWQGGGTGLSIGTGSFGMRGGIGSYYGYTALTSIGAMTDLTQISFITNIYGMVRAYKSGATDQQFQIRNFGMYLLPY